MKLDTRAPQGSALRLVRIQNYAFAIFMLGALFIVLYYGGKSLL